MAKTEIELLEEIEGNTDILDVTLLAMAEHLEKLLQETRKQTELLERLLAKG